MASSKNLAKLKPFPFPLCELHRHLEGSARPRTLWEVACSVTANQPQKLGADSASTTTTDAAAAAAGIQRWLIDNKERNPAETFGARFPTLESFEEVAVLRNPLMQKLEDGSCTSANTSGLTQCMAMFELVRVCLATGPATVERVTYECISDAFEDGVRVLDLRYSPMYIQQGNPAIFPDLEVVHSAVLRGIARARKSFSIAVGLIGIIDRHWPIERATQEAEFMFEHRDDFVGIDLANDESMFPATPFAPLFQRAADLGLSVTVHAAEVSSNSGYENAQVAMDMLKAKRIGHGIGILSDPSGATLAAVKEAGVVVECCPTSNLLVTDVQSYASHPIRQLMDAGVRVTVSTDDPTLFGISLLWELRNLIEEGVLSEDEVKELNQVACEASFVDAAQKEKYFKL